MRIPATLTVLATVMALAGPPAWGASEGLAQAVRARNPELAALAARAGEARAKVGPAGALPDPRVEVEVMDAMTLQGPRAAVRQMLPVAGQPGLMARMATLEADMREAERADRELMLLADGERTLAELAYLGRVEALTEASRKLAAQMARVAEAKYAVGRGMQADVLRAHVARTKLLAPPLGYEARRRSAMALLAALAPGWAPIVPALEPGPALRPAPDLAARARLDSPMLRMKRLALAHGEAEAALARAERIPDLDLGVVAGRSMPGDMPYLGGMAMATVPLWFGTKQAGRVEAADRRVAAEQAALAAAERDLQARLLSAHAQAAAAERLIMLYRGGLITQARQTFKAALAAYQVDKTDFLMVLDALMAFYDAEMAEAMAIAERRQMAAMARALAGADPTESGILGADAPTRPDPAAPRSEGKPR